MSTFAADLWIFMAAVDLRIILLSPWINHGGTTSLHLSTRCDPLFCHLFTVSVQNISLEFTSLASQTHCKCRHLMFSLFFVSVTNIFYSKLTLNWFMYISVDIGY